MRKIITTAALSAAAISTITALAGPANATDDCTPSEGTPGVTGAWAWDSFTDWSASNEQPADPDNQSGETNLDNLIQIGEGWNDTSDSAYRQKVSDGWKRFTGWQVSADAPAVGANEEAGHRYEQEVGNNDALPAPRALRPFRAPRPQRARRPSGRTSRPTTTRARSRACPRTRPTAGARGA